MNEELKNIKVGDQVLIADNKIEIITRIGKSFIQTNRTKYCNRTGCAKPYCLGNVWLQRIATKQDKKDIKDIDLKDKKLDLKYFFLNFDYFKLSAEITESLHTIMLKIKEVKNV